MAVCDRRIMEELYSVVSTPPAFHHSLTEIARIVRNCK